MNRLAIRLVTLTLILAGSSLLMLVGCQRSATSTEGAKPATDPETQALLQEVRQSGQSVQALIEEMRRQQSLEADQQGDPPVVRDLAVLRAALGNAQKAAEAKDAAATTAGLQRLRRVLQALAAELPGSVIAQHADRAIHQIQSQQAVGSTEFVGASQSILAASAAAVKGRPAELVPDVLKDLESAKASVDRGGAAEALQTLEAVVQRATAHPTALAIAKAQAAARGADEAVYRQAWPVVVAELTEINNLLTEISKTVSPAAATATQPATTTGTAGTAPAPSAGQPAATTPPATDQTAPAPVTGTQPVAPAPQATQPQAPAAGTAPAPQAPAN